MWFKKRRCVQKKTLMKPTILPRNLPNSFAECHPMDKSETVNYDHL